MKKCTKCEKCKPISSYTIDNRYNRPMSICKRCRSEAARLWRKSKPNYEKDRYKSIKMETRERHLIRKYGINLDGYKALLLSQNGMCAICSAPESHQYNRVFHVDHCHFSGAVRGLLCRGCNHMLGAVMDDTNVLLRAIKYLETSRKSRQK